MPPRQERPQQWDRAAQGGCRHCQVHTLRAGDTAGISHMGIPALRMDGSFLCPRQLPSPKPHTADVLLRGKVPWGHCVQEDTGLSHSRGRAGGTQELQEQDGGGISQSQLCFSVCIQPCCMMGTPPSGGGGRSKNQQG